MSDEWINVDDRLPSAYVECLVWPIPNRDLNIMSAEWVPSAGRWQQDFYNGYEYEDFYPVVTHTGNHYQNHQEFKKQISYYLYFYIGNFIFW